MPQIPAPTSLDGLPRGDAAFPLDDQPNRRMLAMLRAVSEGRGELICSCEPDLLVDGMACCDQYTAHRLTSVGLIRPVARGATGQRVRAELTSVGRAALEGPNQLTAVAYG